MQRWMEFIETANPDHIRSKSVGPDFADWLAPDPATPKPLVDTAYWALIARDMAQMAHAIHDESDAKTYDDLFDAIRKAFQQAFVKPDGTVGTGTQTSYVVALQMQLLPPDLEKPAVEKLVEDIRKHNGHLTTGFLGTPLLLFALSNHGQLDVAYQLLLNETYPSWGYMLSKGATTWWERWNGDTGDPAMNSYNHYAFGSVVAWVYRYLVGIDTTSDGAGFQHIMIHPHPDAAMDHASGEYDSVYGKVSTNWKFTPGKSFSLSVTVPANTSATIYLPAIPNAQLREAGATVEAKQENGSYVIETGSGSYNFDISEAQ
jgi:alpha-L-rhamnosidase